MAQKIKALKKYGKEERGNFGNASGSLKRTYSACGNISVRKDLQRKPGST